ncbi:hypothetical protein [Microbacterium sp. KRD174]
MNMVIEVDQERFDVREEVQPDGTYRYQFAWMNGPANGGYGFAVGGGKLTWEALERAAQGFVRSFFEPDGIGASDFPSFVEARNSPGG